MDTGWFKFWLAPRQSDFPCANSLLTAFNADQTLLNGCAAADYNCICAQTGSESFPNWYTNNVCNSCDKNLGLNIDPIALLKELCPIQALSLQSSFLCSSFKPAPIPTGPLDPSPTSPALTTHTAHFATSSLNTSTVTQIKATLTVPNPSTSTETIESATATSATSTTPIPVAIHHSSGLATGAKVGIAVGVAVPAIILLLLALFCGRRRRNRNKRASYGDTAKAPTIYTEDGSHSAYALNPGNPAIGAAISTEGKVQLGSPPMTPEVRELYTDEDTEVEESPRAIIHAESPMTSQFRTNPPMLPQPRTESPIVPHNHNRTDSPMSPHSPNIPVPPTNPRRRDDSGGNAVELRGMSSPPGSTIPRKEIQSPITGISTLAHAPQKAHSPTTNEHSESSTSHVRAPPPRTTYSPTPYDRSESRMAALNQIRSDSRMTSSSLRGPVPDMYAYGGETIENDEELARLEEEERMIDEAIQESERIKQLKLEREAIHKRVMEKRFGPGASARAGAGAAGFQTS